MKSAKNLLITLPAEKFLTAIIHKALRGWMELERYLGLLDAAMIRRVADS